jgi:NTP pyrophosphatase (non-canonical NTP hydrolase)
MSDLKQIQKRMSDFARERDWDQFHSPKNLSMALAVEAGELMEHFQWLSEEQSASLPPEKLMAVEHELADILLYLVRLAERTNIDLGSAVEQKRLSMRRSTRYISSGAVRKSTQNTNKILKRPDDQKAASASCVNVLIPPELKDIKPSG